MKESGTPVTYMITATASPAEGGSVTINGEATDTKLVIKGSEVALAASANDGYSFTGWYNGKDLISNENPYTFTATTDLTYTADFEQNGTFPDGDSNTAVDEIHNDIYDGELYDLTGRKIKSTVHDGIYIYNGKKIYIR